MRLIESVLAARIRYYVDGRCASISEDRDGTLSDEQIIALESSIGPRVEYIDVMRFVRSTYDDEGRRGTAESDVIGEPRQYKIDRFVNRPLRHGAIIIPSHPCYAGILRIITHPIARRSASR